MDAKGYRRPEPEPEHLPAPSPGLPTIIQAPTLQGLQRRPAQIVADAKEVANVLREVIEEQNLFTELSYFSQKDQKMITRRHVRVEGWTTAGILCGQLLGDAVVPHTIFTGPIIEDDRIVGYEALVEARSASGLTLATAKGMCMRRESRWKNAEDHAISSMAQTRAAAKALRLTLGWIVTMSGFDATPSEEMDGAVGNGGPQKAAATPRRSRQQQGPRKEEIGEQTIVTTGEVISPAPPADTPWATKLRDLQKEKGLSIPEILDLIGVSDVGAEDPASAMRNHLAAVRLRHDWDSEQAFGYVHDQIIHALSKKERADDGGAPEADEWEQTVAESEATIAADIEAAGEGDAATAKPTATARK